MMQPSEPQVRPFKLEPSLWLVDTGLYLVEQRVFVVADLHLGYEAAMRGAGILLPDTRLEHLLARLDQTFEALDVSAHNPLECLVVDGDLRHGFGPLSPAEQREVDRFFHHTTPFCRRVVVVQGNHDPALNALLRRFVNVSVVERQRRGDWLFTHGDRVPPLSAGVRSVVIGHEHPALALRDPVTGRQERFKVFLRATFQGRTLWVLPSCNTLIQGTDLSKEDVISPLLRAGVWQNGDAFVRDDRGRIYAFGRIGRLI